MIFKSSSSRIVKCLISDWFCQSINSNCQRSWSNFSLRFFFLCYNFWFLCSFFTFTFSSFIGRNFFLFFHSCCYNIYGSIYYYQKWVKRKFIERVNFVKFIHQEKYESSSWSCWSICFGCIINIYFSYFCNFYFFLNFCW